MSDPKSSSSRGSNAGLIALCVVGSLILGTGGCLGGGVLAARSAYAKASKFCESVQPGEDIAAAESRARTVGLKISSTAAAGSGQGQLIAYSAFMLHRNLCTVEHASGKVTSKRLSSAD